MEFGFSSNTVPGGSDGKIQYNNGGIFGGFWSYDDINNKIIIDTGGSSAHPKISFGDGDTGFYESAVNSITLAVSGSNLFLFNSQGILGYAATPYPAILNEAASSTNPVFTFGSNDFDTGIGRAAADQLSLISGGIEALRLEEASSHVIIKNEVHAGLTASTTQTQGQGALLSSYNEVATVANPNDTVTLPSAAAGYHCVIINNGANTLQIFPASGDDLGSGVNTATTLSSGNNVHYFAYDATNWEII